MVFHLSIFPPSFSFCKIFENVKRHCCTLDPWEQSGENKAEEKGKKERIECQARNLGLKINFHPCCKKISTYVMLRLVSMMFMLEGMEATSMAVLLVMLASPSDPESDPETTLRWPLGT